MSAPNSLQELYVEEMQDLWSANDQMTRVIKELSEHAHDNKLKHMLIQSVDGITKHTATIKLLIKSAGGTSKSDHCKGMEGLANEALTHGIKEAPADGNLRDIAIIAQYQRMSHYGIAGFGSAVAYAEALRRKDDVAKLKEVVVGIYKADEYASTFAGHLEKAAA